MTDAVASGPIKAKARAPRPAPPVLRVAERQAAVRTLGVRPALTIGAVDDPAEREAEATAERIVAMPVSARPADVAPRTGPQPAVRASTEDTVGGAPEPGDMGALENGAPVEGGGEVLGESEGHFGESGAPSGESGDSAGQFSTAPATQGAVQAARDGTTAVGREGGAAPADVAARIAKSGVGRPLPADTRAFMEPRFGLDFSKVRLHDAPGDRSAARRIGARAFTLGRRIWLGDGETGADRRLMAHELTHVVQQTRRQPVEAMAVRATLRRSRIADDAEW